MAQIEIFEFLKNERARGNEEFFNAQQIYKALLNSNGSVCHKPRIYAALMQLEAYEYLEVEKIGKSLHKKRVFRIKKKYLDKNN